MAGLSAKAVVDLMMAGCTEHSYSFYREYRVNVLPIGCYRDETRTALRKKLMTYVEKLIEAEQAALTTGESHVS